MANIEFVLGLKETVSGGIQRLGATTRGVFGGIDKLVAGTQGGLNKLGAMEYKLKVDSSSVRQAQDDIERLGDKARGVGAMDIFKGSFFGGLAVRGVERGLDALKDVGRDALTAGMDAEQQIIALKTFVGKDRAKEIYADLQKSSALTPFTTAQILPGGSSKDSAGIAIQPVEERCVEPDECAERHRQGRERI